MAIHQSTPTSSPSIPNITHIYSFSPFYYQCHRRQSKTPLLLCNSSKKKDTSFGDQLLDYIEGGPKLRKWYGAPELLPKDGSIETEQDEFSEIDRVRDAVLVTDGDSEIGQMVILSLILKRAQIKTLVKDKQASLDAFGTYVEPMTGDLDNKAFLTKALRGVRAIISPSNDGFFCNIERTKGAQQIILLSQLAFYRGTSGLQAMMNNKLKKLAERDEEIVISSGIPYTIIRAGFLQNVPGGKQGFSFQPDKVAKGKLSKEDAAVICVQALDLSPERGLILEVVNGDEKVADWKLKFAALMKGVEQTTQMN